MKPSLLLLSFTPVLAWKDNTAIHISQAIAKRSNLSDCWICRQKLGSVHEARDPWYVSLSLINTPHLGNFVSRFYAKKGIQDKNNQNATAYMVHRPLIPGGIHDSKLTLFDRSLHS